MEKFRRDGKRYLVYSGSALFGDYEDAIKELNEKPGDIEVVKTRIRKKLKKTDYWYIKPSEPILF